MTKFNLARMAAVDLEFDGELLADETTEAPGKRRWQEVRIYSVAGEPPRWVVERYGRTLVDGEGDRPLVTVCASVPEVRAALLTTQEGRTFITDVCYDALKAAVAKDPRLADALIERL